MFYVYILYSATYKRYYIGSTKNVPIRVARHNAGHSLSTKAYRPWKLVFTESFESKSEAVKREMEIKSWKSSKFMEEKLGLKD